VNAALAFIITFFSTPDFKVAEGGLYVLRMFFILKYFSDFCQTNYLNIHQINLYEICRQGC